MSTDITKSMLERIKKGVDDLIQFQGSKKDSIQALLDNLAKELSEHGTQLTALKQEVATLDAACNDLEKTRNELEQRISSLKSSTSEKTQQITTLTSQKNDLSSRKSSLLQELRQKQDEFQRLTQVISSIEDELAALQQQLAAVEARKEQMIQEKEAQLKELEDKLSKAKDENPIAHFLVYESDVELPAVELLAVILQNNGTLSVDDIKREVDLPPVVVTSQLKRMAQKGVIRLDETTGDVFLF